jgi:hypothetical protein
MTHDMDWLPCAIWCMVGLFLLCVAIVAWCVIRDRNLRGTRVTNEELSRERVTISLPNFCMRDFKNRTYGDTQ